MIDGVVKELARFEHVSHEITGDRRLRHSDGAGHVDNRIVIDITTRLTYVEVLAHKEQATTRASSCGL